MVEIPVDPGRDRTADTVRAMHEGADVIYQAPLGDERWYGRADFLKRVPKASALGAWSYEVVDAKLATETRAGTLLQLCLYSELVGAIQGLDPNMRTSSRRTTTSIRSRIGSRTTRRTTGS